MLNKKKLIALVPYAVALLISFYLLPFAIIDTGSAIFMLLVCLPAITFICGVIYGILNGFNLLLTLLVAILFTPTLFIHYNSSAWVYIIAYAVIAFIGNALGRIFYRKK